MIKFLLTLLMLSFSWAAQAQDYPNRPIKLVVPFAAGSTIDLLARAVAEDVSAYLGQPVIVEAKPGAGSAVGAAAVMNSAPDGYTLLLASNATLAVNPILYKKLPYDPNRFELIGAIGGFPSFLLVGGDSKYKTFTDFVKAAKEHPGELKYGSSGVGTTGHIAGAMLESAAGIKMLHVPYKDGPQALTATITGEVDAIFYPSGAAMSMIQTGKVRPLAVSTAARTSSLPDVPTIAESGFPGFSLIGWTVLAAPGKTPTAVLGRLKDAVNHLYASAAYKAKLNSLGLVPQELTGQQLQAFVQAEQRSMTEVAKRADIHPQ